MATTLQREDVLIGAPALSGELALPTKPCGLVVFAHGSGSSRASPRNRFVAGVLHAQLVGTLLFDLLTEAEAAQRANVFDMGLLARRIGQALDWIAARTDLAHLPIGLFGASTGAGAALIAAAQRPGEIAGVVSRGGRPDLAGAALPEVRAPTLLIVGGDDPVVIDLNRQAMRDLRCEVRLEIVPHATHLFEEPGTLEAVARSAAHWFASHFATAGPQ